MRGRSEPLISPVVAGLVWTMNDGSPAEHVLCGPALGAALGARMAGASPELLIAFPASLSTRATRLARALDPAGRLLTRAAAPAIHWTAKPLLAETRRWSLRGDPRACIAECEPRLLADRTLVLANGNPGAYAALLRSADPGFVALDVDGSWIASQTPALSTCVDRAHLVTITRRDYGELPISMRLRSAMGKSGGGTLVIKAGDQGIDVVSNGERVHLPAPTLRGPALTDVGAGDVLLGVLATLLGTGRRPPSIRDVCEAYALASPLLAPLLMARSFPSFADQVLDTANV